MRTWILALVLVALPVSALDVILDGDNVGTLQKITVTQDKVNVSTVSTDQGNEPAKPAPEPELEPTPEPSPESGCSSPDVRCAHPINDWPNERENNITVPAGKTLASKFTLGDGLEYGSISYQAHHNRRSRVWISEVPGGPALDDRRCSRDNLSFYFVIKWAAFEWNQACSLEPGGEYYLNMKSLDGKTYRVNRAAY